jgi:hypothetical protein
MRYGFEGDRRRGGFSMVEALIAVSITTIAGGALLSALGAAVLSSTEAAHATVARGLAAQLMDEIAAAGFPMGGVQGSTVSNGSREGFDDIDDYHQWSERPPATRAGVPLGTDAAAAGMRLKELQADGQFLSQWTREVQVERVQPASNSASGWQPTSQQSNFRRVTVRVKLTDAQNNTQTLVENVRIFSHVPSAP